MDYLGSFLNVVGYIANLAFALALLWLAIFGGTLNFTTNGVLGFFKKMDKEGE